MTLGKDYRLKEREDRWKPVAVVRADIQSVGECLTVCGTHAPNAFPDLQRGRWINLPRQTSEGLYPKLLPLINPNIIPNYFPITRFNFHSLLTMLLLIPVLWKVPPQPGIFLVLIQRVNYGRICRLWGNNLMRLLGICRHLPYRRARTANIGEVTQLRCEVCVLHARDWHVDN